VLPMGNMSPKNGHGYGHVAHFISLVSLKYLWKGKGREFVHWLPVGYVNYYPLD